jgi:hypothetical protein
MSINDSFSTVCDLRPRSMPSAVSTMTAALAGLLHGGCFYNPESGATEHATVDADPGESNASTALGATTSGVPTTGASHASTIDEPGEPGGDELTASTSDGSSFVDPSSTSSGATGDTSDGTSTGAAEPSAQTFTCDDICGQPFVVGTSESLGLCGLFLDQDRNEVQVVGDFTGELAIHGEPVTVAESSRFVARFEPAGELVEMGVSHVGLSDCRAAAGLADGRILVAEGAHGVAAFSSADGWTPLAGPSDVGVSPSLLAVDDASFVAIGKDNHCDGQLKWGISAATATSLADAMHDGFCDPTGGNPSVDNAVIDGFGRVWIGGSAQAPWIHEPELVPDQPEAFLAQGAFDVHKFVYRTAIPGVSWHSRVNLAVVENELHAAGASEGALWVATMDLSQPEPGALEVQWFTPPQELGYISTTSSMIASDDGLIIAGRGSPGPFLVRVPLELSEPAWMNLGVAFAGTTPLALAPARTGACAGGVFLASRIDVLYDFLTSTCLAVGSPEQGDLFGVQLPPWW